MNPGEFLTLQAAAEVETKVRGSLFIGYAAPATDEDAARAEIGAWSRPRFDATHHCTAWRFRNLLWRANDDGEPSGSAGAPILAAIDGARLVDVVVIVTRYYGGTKLGVGGLIRAYGEVAAMALASAPKRVGVPAARVAVEYGYEHTSAVMRVVEQLGAREMEHGYAGGGARGRLELSVSEARLPELHEMLREATAGAIVPEPIGTHVLYRASVDADP
jgi:uncharacterized YigZ family protein